MYKLLLCWRYLRTRYIALVCIVSVTLGVATMIVVNSVMAGFTHEMQSRLNGMLGDVIVKSRSMDGAPDADGHMDMIRAAAGDSIEGLSPTLEVPSLLYLTVNGQVIPRQVMLIGIDETSYASVSKFGEYLQHPENRGQLSFLLRDGGYDDRDHQVNPSESKVRKPMRYAGWPRRRHLAEIERAQREEQERIRQAAKAAAGEGPSDNQQLPVAANPFLAAAGDQPQGRDFDTAREQFTGIVLGMGICSVRDTDGTDYFHAIPGDDVKTAFPLAVVPPKITGQQYTIVDFYESKMSEFDASVAFVPLRSLQRDRGLIDPQTGLGKFTSILIKLKKGVSPEQVRDKLQTAFPVQMYEVSTWRDQRGPLLAAVQMETAVLNVLLFLIIAVAGFGILAIFYMIVVEKTRDIGILKSLGASGPGVQAIFLGYGLSLGMVGAGVGTGIGLAFVAYINEIADLLGEITGQQVFDPSVYYFYRIPTIVEPFTVAWIASGAVAIAVLASVLPARRAARLHPVRALRYE